MFYNQPLAIRFGTELIRVVEAARKIEPYWDRLDIAVAWVRGSGVKYLSESLTHFLKNGGALSLIVGIDLRNTTREGLEGLLALEAHGDAETFVYHNEGGGVFHPKLYLFRNEAEARLIVGSNNLTESGLYVNVEAGLRVDVCAKNSVVKQAVDALSSWKSAEDRLAAKLTPVFLAQLVKEGYVPDEAAAVTKIRAEARRSAGRTTSLFGSKRYTPPHHAPKGALQRSRNRGAARPAATPETEITVPAGSVLLMRLRKASVTKRRTQTQIPIRVAKTFFAGLTEVRSSHSGQRHKIVVAEARGGTNTLKLEIPEMRDFEDPVARFERQEDGIAYEVYDIGSARGDQIWSSLQEGRASNDTQLSVSNAEQATWWRAI